MHAKSQPRYLDLSPDSNCKVRRVWNFWASRLQRWYNDTSWRTSWNSQVVTNRDIVASSVDHPADNRWQGGGRHTMRLTRKWLGFVTHQTQICHHMLGFVRQQTQICHRIHQLLVRLLNDSTIARKSLFQEKKIKVCQNCSKVRQNVLDKYFLPG